MHPWVKQITLLLYVFLLCSFLQLIQALHEDQVGLHDWGLQFIGRPVEVLVSARQGRNEPSRSLVYAFTDQNVLAAIDLKYGEIAWRHVFESNANRTILSLVLTDEEICGVFNHGRLLRCFDQLKGAFKWERTVGGKDSYQTSCAAYGFASADNALSKIVCASGDRISAMNSKLGTLLWDVKQPKSQRRFVYTRAGEIFAISLNDRKIGVKRLLSGSGEAKGPDIERSAVVNPSSSRCQFIQPSPQAAAFLVCVDESSETLFSFSTVTAETSQQLFTFKELGFVDVFLGSVTFQQYYFEGLFGLTVAEQTFILQLQIDGKIKFLRKENALVDACASQQLLSVSTMNHDLVLRSANPVGGSTFEFNGGQQVALQKSSGDAVKLYGVSTSDGDCVKSSFLFWTNGDVLGLVSQGKLVWKREEGLASLNITATVDLPVSDIEALVEEEFEEKGSFPVHFVKRLVAQGLQLKKFVEFGANRILTGLRTGKFFQKEKLERDYFNTHKIIVGVTDRGKVFGLDSRNGDVIYSILIKDMVKPQYGPISFFLQRTGAHAPFASQAVVIGAAKTTGNGLLYFFDCITGEELEKPLQLDRRVLQTGLIPVMNSNHLEAVFVLDSDLNVAIYPNLNVPELKEFLTRSLHIFDADFQNGVLRGYRVTANDQGFKAKEIFANPVTSVGEVIISVTPKRPHDAVYSQGRVLADRRVLYKYINPNLISVITQGVDETKKPYLKVLTVDGITGRIVMSLIHRRAQGPVHAVHSENWLMYAFWNEKARSSELSVVELYRGFEKPNKTYFSSVESFEKPEVSSAGFKLPGFVDAMRDTVTTEGISHKNLIVALSSGSIMQIPKVLLDPRRPMFPTQAEREEGLIPYAPELPYMPDNVINYYKKVSNIRAVHTGAAGLESISLVFCYGLDLYFTRVTPSALFDVLSDSFDYWILSVVMLVMTVASLIVRNLANAKALKQAWK